MVVMSCMGMGMGFMVLWGLVGVALLVFLVLGVIWLLRR
jgi:putative membrane protein